MVKNRNSFEMKENFINNHTGTDRGQMVTPSYSRFLREGLEVV